MPTDDEQDGHKIIARNKRARHDYQIIDAWEAG
ncbi:MAG: SsrA-binding protein, partial [Gemmatimonadota bacterium]|nr:SsrA-binding protein [Gemmatimonadota bacterium]